jgi:diaminopimelate decarboxylase
MKKPAQPNSGHGASTISVGTTPWWAGGTLRAGAHGLEIASRRAEALAAELGTPLYLYDGARVREQLGRLREALSGFARWRIYYALKANRFPPLLSLLRTEGDVGIDACSPREVACALAAGFHSSEISVTASNLSPADLGSFRRDAVHVNFDQISALRRFGALDSAGTRVGLRVDPMVRVGYGENARTDYNGGKLGLAPEDLNAALAAARHAGLVVDTLHMHLGWGLRDRDEAAFREGLAILAAAAKRIVSLECINVGGGLGGRLRETDIPLSLARWGEAIREAFPAAASEGRPLIACEPGTFIVASAGILVTRVTTVWDKRGERWIGLDAGQAVNVYSAHYGLELDMVAVARPLADHTIRCNIVGNINEAGDVFAFGRMLPEIAEGELIALLPAGAYGSSMASEHCLRGNFFEHML